MMLMPHDPPHAGLRLEALGYRKARDLLAYVHDLETPLLPVAQAVVGRGLPSGVTLRPMRRGALRGWLADHPDIVRLTLERHAGTARLLGLR